MAAARHLNVGDWTAWRWLSAGLPILDTALVSISRIRRGVTLLTGGPITSPIALLPLHRPRMVAVALALGQAGLCTLALFGDRLGATDLGELAGGAVLLGLLAIAVLDSDRWRRQDQVRTAASRRERTDVEHPALVRVPARGADRG